VNVKAPLRYVGFYVGQRVGSFHKRHDFDAFMSQKPSASSSMLGHTYDGDLGRVYARRGRDGCQKVLLYIVDVLSKCVYRRV
jgi:hypothetical protein